MWITNPPYEWISRKLEGVLLADLVWDDPVYGVQVAPAGFSTDYGSIPKLLWWFDNPFEPDIRRAATLHDWLYHLRGKYGVTRLMADQMLLRGMLADGAKAWKATARYRAVRTFGGINSRSQPWQT
jgi:hypothetical protein